MTDKYDAKARGIVGPMALFLPMTKDMMEGSVEAIAAALRQAAADEREMLWKKMRLDDVVLAVNEMSHSSGSGSAAEQAWDDLKNLRDAILRLRGEQ